MYTSILLTLFSISTHIVITLNHLSLPSATHECMYVQMHTHTHTHIHHLLTLFKAPFRYNQEAPIPNSLGKSIAGVFCASALMAF